MIFLHGTLVQDEAPPHEVWIQKVEQIKRHYVDKHFKFGNTWRCYEADLEHITAVHYIQVLL